MKLNEFITESIKFEESQLILVGGRPAMGKTAFANSIMVDLARKNKCSAFVSLEMSKEIWNNRMHKMGIDDELLKKIDVFALTCVTPNQIEKILQKKYDLIVIDYLQLVDREDEGSVEVQRKLAELCRKFCCPVIILSQLSRVVETRDNHIPQLSDLNKNAYDIELYDEIMFIYRDAYYDENADKTKFTVFNNNKEIQLIWNADILSVE